MSQRPWLDVAIKAALIASAAMMYADLRAEMRSIRFEINSLEAKIDSVETKVDEMRGYFKYYADAMRNEAPPAEPKE